MVATHSNPAGTYVVTGAAGGIGAAIARHLVQTARGIALVDVAGAALNDLAGDLASSTCSVLTIECDLRQPHAVQQAYAMVVERFGGLSGMVAAHGQIMTRTPITDLTLDAWENTVSVNLTSMFLATQGALRVMLREGTQGSIVTLGSLGATSARPGWSAYCASKAGVIQLTRVLAIEGAEAGIRVNAVSPGSVATPQLFERYGPGIVEDRVHGSAADMRVGIPLRRLAKPEDVAATVGFLLSPASAHITGQSIKVDGGESAI